MNVSQNLRAVMSAGVILSAMASAAAAKDPVQLITADEASLPATKLDGIGRNVTRGPGIDSIAPSAVGVVGSFRFAVKFKPRNGVKIDPKDVRVTYLREPHVDLTARLKEFITADGIDAPAVMAPAGEHVIRVEAIDKEGRTGRGQIVLTVKASQ